MKRFHKYQGAGNDFIVFNSMNDEGGLPNWLTPQKVQYLCRRKYGIGGDGVILLTGSEKAEVGMRLFNADGSEAELSGNGLRCLALFVRELGLCFENPFTVETGGGVNRVEIAVDDRVKVWMPKPKFQPEDIPILDSDECVDRKKEFGGDNFTITALSVGNPHCVIFNDFNIDDARKWGWEIEKSEYFPRRTNVEFARVLEQDRIRVVVWERGVGITDACGSGACAAVIAGIRTGRLEFDRPVTVEQVGGNVLVTVSGDYRAIILEGEAEKVFEGEVDLQG
ncbi:MAG: diaminopimelate epimerase [candidate division Zixibacteria bacterium]|nr:diaminopimelate epimerase [Candidatus Tariuqbacter arcticus]